MRRGGILLDLDRVRRLGEGEAPAAKSHLVEAVAQDGPHDVAGVLHAVYVADLVPVVRRDRSLDDPKVRLVELHDDLGVEVEPVRIRLIRHGLERLDRVGAIARMPFRELQPDGAVGDLRQDPVPDALVQRHTPLACRTAGHHA
jgi:hypothetical protein